MKRTLAVAGALALVGIALFVGPLVLIEPAEATYSIEAQSVDEVPADATVVPLEEADPSMRDRLREAIEGSDEVTVGNSRQSMPSYVRYDGQVYQFITYVGDPGGGGAVIALASFGLGILAFVGAAGAIVVALWRQYVR